MATGPNWAGLDKGFLAQGTAEYKLGQVVKLGTVAQSVTPLTAAPTATDVLGVAIEAVDADKVKTGKVFIGVRLAGLATVRVAAADIAKGSRLTANAAGRVVVQETAGGPVLGVAVEAGGAIGTTLDILLTPGATL